MLAGALACSPPNARETFDANVAPVLEQSCASSRCHGVLPGTGEHLDRTQTYFDIDEQGQLSDLETAYLTALAHLNTDEQPGYSSLLRKPLATAFGGLVHYGGENFRDPQTPGYQAMLAWATMESGGGEAGPTLTPLQEQFAAYVEPQLASHGCMTGNCHGMSAAIPYRLDPGVDDGFPRASTAANYEATRTMLSLDGNPAMSRLLRKGLPLHDGGIVHKGGNRSFFYADDDPARDAITEWACAERAELGGRCGDTVEGIFVVLGDVSPADPFVLATPDRSAIHWWSAAGGLQALNLGGADTRDPAIDPTGRWLAFARREDGEGEFRIWRYDRDTAALDQLTSGPGDDRDPTFGPEGHVWFVSSRSGTLADDGVRQNTEIYSVDPSTLGVTRWTWTPHVERKPTFLVHGEEHAGEVLFTALRDAVPGAAVGHAFRFPPDLSTEYHQHFGTSPPESLSYDMVESADGRFLAILGDLDNAWEAGRLAVIDRNFGPTIPDGATPALPFYAEPLARIDAGAAAEGIVERIYRDPAALPDGNVLVAVADGPLDLSDATAKPQFSIRRLVLEEAADGSGPALHSSEVLIEANTSVYDPVPVFVRQPPPVFEESRDEAASTGLLVHNGIALIDAVLGNLPPSGSRPVRDDIVAVRLVEAIVQFPGDREPVPEWGERASTAGLGGYSPAGVLAEVPLAADGSLYVELPAGVPFRMQALDARGMAVGADHNRWFYLAPGQVLKQGLGYSDGAAYATLCAACHGALNGDPTEVFIEPDVITTASVTLSRYANQDPRHPLAALVPAESSRRTVDFVDDISPLLSSCRECHYADNPDGGLRLDTAPDGPFNHGYTALFEANLLVPGRAGESGLVSTLAGKAHGNLTEAEFATLCLWIDLGAPWSVP